MQSLNAWGVGVPLAWVIGVRLGYGVVGAWWALVVSMAVLSCALLWRFGSGAWRHIQI